MVAPIRLSMDAVRVGRKSYGNPRHRASKSAVDKAQESLRHAHQEVVAAAEWLNRGDPGQFLEESLDRANLAARFLLDFLAANGRELPVCDSGDD